MFKKLKGRFAENKSKNERTVISYEDVPLDDYEQEPARISPEVIKKILIGVLGALLLAVIVLAFAFRDKLTWNNISVWWNYEVMGAPSSGYPVNIVGSDVAQGNVAVTQNRVAYASDTSFVTLNSKGGEVNNTQLRYTKPVMKSAENRFLIFGLGEKNYQLATFDKNGYSGTAAGNIYAGDVAPNGKYCLAVEGNGFYSELYAYDADNNRVYKYSFSEYYINSVAINMSGTGCIASGISNNNGEIKTGVYMLDFSKEEPVGKYEIDGDYIIDSRFISGGRCALVGANASYVAMMDEDVVVKVEYEGKTLKNYSFNTSVETFSLALSKSGDGRQCDLITYNDNGVAVFTADSNAGSDSVSAYRNTVATMDNNTIYIYNKTGELRGTCFAGSGARRLILFSDDEAYVLSVTQIRKINLRDTESTADSAVG